MPIIIVSLIVLLVITLFIYLEVLILNWLLKKFKISETSLKKTFKILLLQIIFSLIASIIINIIFSIVNFKLFSFLASLVVGFFIFNALFEQYYKTTIKQNLTIFISYSILSVILGILLVIPIRVYIFQPFTISGDSMTPTLKNSEYIFLQKFDKNYKRGDIIIHKDPKGESKLYVKRIIGLPGETVEVQDGQIYITINNLRTKLEETYVSQNMVSTLPNEIVILEQKEYYVLSDNRQVNNVYGAIDKDLIIGKYWFSPLSN